MEGHTMTTARSETAGIGFITGMAFGAFLAMMLTPKTGQEMRRGVKEKIQHVGNELHEAKDDATDIAQDVANKAKSTMQRGRDKVSSGNTV
jgi:gas vesicle protein